VCAESLFHLLLQHRAILIGAILDAGVAILDIAVGHYEITCGRFGHFFCSYKIRAILVAPFW